MKVGEWYNEGKLRDEREGKAQGGREEIKDRWNIVTEEETEDCKGKEKDIQK